MTDKTVRELEKITVQSDTRDILAHAAQEARRLDDYFLVDIDAHVTETAFWSEITDRIDNDYPRRWRAVLPAIAAARRPGCSTRSPACCTRTCSAASRTSSSWPRRCRARRTHRQVELARRAMDAHGHRLQGGVPDADAVARHASAGRDRGGARPRLQSLAGRGTPAARAAHQGDALPAVQRSRGVRGGGRELRRQPGVIGFTVISTRNKPVHHNSYMRLYAAHGGDAASRWRSTPASTGATSRCSSVNRFISMHALSFVHYNLIHLTNWIINGLPERFPKLKVMWVESGLAWVPFLMQRLDSEYMMRSCGGAAAQAPAERVHARHVLHQPAAGDAPT